MSDVGLPAWDLDLLLIGKTGTGKSATGNTILGRKCFKSSPSFTSVTKETQFDYCEYGDRVIKVVDGPGIGDTDLSKEDALQLVINAMSFAIAANPNGYHAFLLVIRFGVRFTEEDKQTIHLLKQIFGGDFVAKYCILVMTGGDNCTLEETGMKSFLDWCRTQEGEFKFLLNECKHRIVLFDNRTTDPVKIKRQIDDLIARVDGMNYLHLRYTDNHFKAAQTQRDKIILEAKIPIIKEETMKEASLILQHLANVQLQDPQKQLLLLTSLKSRAENLLRCVRQQDKGTGILKDLLQNAKHILTCVNDQIESTEMANKLKSEREDFKRKLAELREEKQRQIQELENQQNKAMEVKIRELEQEDEEQEARIREIEWKLRSNVEYVQEEFNEARGKSTWEWIKSVGLDIISIVLPAALSFLVKLVLKK